MWNRIEDKVARGERLTREDGIYLLTDAPLVELGALARQLSGHGVDPRHQHLVRDAVADVPR